VLEDSSKSTWEAGVKTLVSIQAASPRLSPSARTLWLETGITVWRAIVKLALGDLPN
jgi:hypothetical protein